MANPSENVIETRGLTKTYKNVQALQSLDLTVTRNSIYGFLGPNGAGKTTTIKLLLGLARPTAGSGSVFGHDIATDNIAIRQRVGYLAQDPSFYPYMTARETLRFTVRFFFNGPKDGLEKRINETLELVGLEDKADRPIKGFSGGEMQRLGIAQAQINNPDLLILDEPAANLDPMGRRDVLAVMDRLRQVTTIFYSTHILEDVQRVSDSVAILNHGRLVAEGPIETLLSQSGQTTYTVKLQGDTQRALERLRNVPWVSSIETVQQNGALTLAVSVSDEEIAQQRMLRLLLEDQALTVHEYRPRQANLEEVFLSIVEEDDHGK